MWCLPNYWAILIILLYYLTPMSMPLPHKQTLQVTYDGILEIGIHMIIPVRYFPLKRLTWSLEGFLLDSWR